jgi:hypothetical protein
VEFIVYVEIAWQIADRTLELAPEEDVPQKVVHPLLDQFLTALNACRPRLTGDEANHALREIENSAVVVWNELFQSWLGVDHVGRLIRRENGDPEFEFEIMTGGTPLYDRLRVFRDDFDRFRLALPGPEGDLMWLGALVTACNYALPTTLSPSGSMLPAALKHPESTARFPLVRLAEHVSAFQDVDVELSREKYFKESQATSDVEYPLWFREKLRRLFGELLPRLSEQRDRITNASGHKPACHWIPASEACAIAEGLGVNLTMSKISKLSKTGDAPFLYDKPAKNRLNVDLVSFVVHVLGEWRQRKDTDDPEEITRRANALRAQKDRHRQED